MAYREVGVIEVREMLRLWLLQKGYREIARLMGSDRKLVRRYVAAAVRAGLGREASVDQLTDELVGQVVGEVSSGAPGTHGATWRLCDEHREQMAGWLKDGLRLTKVQVLLKRQTGQLVPYRTLHRFATKEFGFGKGRVTVRVADGKPGEELQMDFGRLGYLRDESGQRRLVHGLVFTACLSRHQFVWLSFHQRLEDIIEGCERAWAFYGGVFRVVILDNQKAVVVKADAVAPLLNERFIEYAQARGFVVDATRVRKPDDKPRVERAVPYVRESFFQGEDFSHLEEAQRRVEIWCMETAGRRRHGTIQRQPVEVFEAEERPVLLAVPESAYDVPLHVDVGVQRDHHLVVDRALYSVPTHHIGKTVHARADRQLVRVYYRRKLIKIHPRQAPGGRSTDPSDYPPEVAVYATRDEATLTRRAHEAGEHVGTYAERLLDAPLPWTRMRQVYRLLGLVRRYGASRVEQACQRALALDVVEVTRIQRVLEQALEGGSPPSSPAHRGVVAPLRFARPATHFAVTLTQGAQTSSGGNDERD